MIVYYNEMIEQLPTASLVKIFNLTSPADLANVAQCSKKLNQVITEFMCVKYPSIRIDFQYLNYNKVQKFTYKDGSQRDFNALLDSPRHYQNYVLLNFNKEHTDRLGNKWLQLFKKQINTRCLKIKSDCMDLQQLSNLMKLTHRLVYLQIDGYRIAKMDSPLDGSDVASLPCLKHLKVHSFLDTSPQIFMIFQSVRGLKTISLSALVMVNKKIKSINDFIFNQRALEQLELIGLDSQNALFDYDALDDIRFKLKKLNIEYNGYSVNLEKFAAFFCHQRALKEIKLALDLRHSLHHAQDMRFCDEMMRHLMTLDHLATLNILVNKYTLKNVEAFNFCNKRVSKLIFENESRDNNDLLVALLKSFPNLRHLELAVDYSDDVLLQLPQLIHLNHLKLTDYHQGLLKLIKCAESLNSISLQYCYTKHSGPDWLEFLRNNPNVRKIHIHHSIDFMDDAIINIISAACPNLEYFSMTDSTANNLSTEAYKIFQRNCPNMKLLKLTDKPNGVSLNKNQSFHDLLANIKCVIFFYVICIILFILLIVLMWKGLI